MTLKVHFESVWWLISTKCSKIGIFIIFFSFFSVNQEYGYTPDINDFIGAIELVNTIWGAEIWEFIFISWIHYLEIEEEEHNLVAPNVHSVTFIIFRIILELKFEIIDRFQSKTKYFHKMRRYLFLYHRFIQVIQWTEFDLTYQRNIKWLVR